MVRLVMHTYGQVSDAYLWSGKGCILMVRLVMHNYGQVSHA